VLSKQAGQRIVLAPRSGVYCTSFAEPEAVLAYLSRYTHRVAIANSRLIACDDNGITPDQVRGITAPRDGSGRRS
jgi:hypothetical protein